MSERYCNKCGYFGPDEIHNKPGHLYQCGYLSSPIQQPDTIQVSRAEYEALMKDAERLDHLDRHASVNFDYENCILTFEVPEDFDGCNYIREAIDAAIKQEGGA
jgi:hypothetical protein